MSTPLLLPPSFEFILIVSHNLLREAKGGDCWPLQRKHAGSTKPYQGLSNHILSLLRLSSIMLGPRGKSRDNPGHFQPLHLQSFPLLSRFC